MYLFKFRIRKSLDNTYRTSAPLLQEQGKQLVQVLVLVYCVLHYIHTFYYFGAIPGEYNLLALEKSQNSILYKGTWLAQASKITKNVSSITIFAVFLQFFVRKCFFALHTISLFLLTVGIVRGASQAEFQLAMVLSAPLGSTTYAF